MTPHPIHFLANCLDQPERIVNDIPSSFSIVLITDENVWLLYGKYFYNIIKTTRRNVECIVIPNGEEGKTRKTLQMVEDVLFEKKCDKETVLIALGGGVVSDLSGFIASIYMRGIFLILIPTTLLSMVDSAIGGKNGINTLYGKNLLGTIYPPHAVFLDLLFLKTLPQEYVLDGISEVCKKGILLDEKLFSYLEKNEEISFQYLVEESVRLKCSILVQDMHDTGVRNILNFGHTFAHAFEKISGYTISHGKAVWAGMVCESFLSYELGFLSSLNLERIEKVAFKYIYDRFYKNSDVQDLFCAICCDKKKKEAIPFCIAIDGIGCCSFLKKIMLDENLVQKALQHLCTR